MEEELDTPMEDSFHSLCGSTSVSQASSKVIVKDSIEVISELIQELQAMEMDIPPPVRTVDSKTQVIPLGSKAPTSSLRFSLIRFSKNIGLQGSCLSSINQFHCLPSIQSSSTLPIHNDNPVSTLKTTSKLSALGIKSFFRPNRANRNDLFEDYYIKTSLSYDELKVH